MHIVPTNITNKQINFGKLIKSKHNFNEAQNQVAEEITSVMTEPNPKFGNVSATDYYESKKIDFIMIPHNKNSVLLNGCKNVKTIGIGIEKEQRCDYEFKVGIYDSEHKLDINDIDVTLKEIKKNQNGSFLNMILLGVLMLTLAFGQRYLSKKAKQITPVEMVDSTLHKADTIMTDTLLLKKAKQ